MKQITKAIFCLATLPLLNACVGMAPAQLDWRSNTQAAEQPAILRCWQSLQIDSLDGDEKKSRVVGGGLYFRKCDIKIEPGPHTLVVHHDYAMQSTVVSVASKSDPIAVRFVAEPGAIYQLVGGSKRTSNGYDLHTFEVTLKKEAK